MSKKLFISSLFVIALFGFVGNANAATLSQTSVYLSVGQSSSVYATNVISSLYVSTNTNPSVASVSISGASILIYGNGVGTSSATICDYGSACNIIYITVSSNGSSYGTLSLSQTSLSLTAGQTSTITAYNSYGTSGTLYISSNSNPSVATATVVGNAVSVYGVGTGTSNLYICQSYGSSSCGTVYITVNGYGYNNGTNLGLNISSLTLQTGSSATLSSSNSNYYSSQGLYVSSNSNPNIVSVGASSLVNGCTAGALYSITSGLPCNGSIYNNYNSSSYMPGCYAGALYSITTGQLCSSQIYNGGSNGSVTISAIAPGTDTLSICQGGGVSACSTIYVTVTGYAVPLSYSPTTYSPTTYNNSGIPTVYSNSSAD